MTNENIRQRAEMLLAKALEICSRYDFPIQMLRIDAPFDGGGWQRLLYQDGAWREVKFEDFPGWLYGIWDTERMYSHESWRHHGEPRVFLWFGDKDLGQEITSLAVPWICLGYVTPDGGVRAMWL